jgi:CHC2 zinc finger
MLNFAELKRIRIVDVVGRYAIRLRFKGEWASTPCPLPTHKAGDRGRSFTINLTQNYWRCFSASCNEKNEGRKGGDVINFVALMENCRERDAAQKLAEWYGVETKNRPHIETGSVPRKELALAKPTPANNSLESSSPAIAVKSGFLHDVGVKMEDLLCVIEDEMIRKQVKKEVMRTIFESYKNGKAARL